MTAYCVSYGGVGLKFGKRVPDSGRVMIKRICQSLRRMNQYKKPAGETGIHVGRSRILLFFAIPRPQALMSLLYRAGALLGGDNLPLRFVRV